MNKLPQGWKESTLGIEACLTRRSPQYFSGEKAYLATLDVKGFKVTPSEYVTFYNRPSRAQLQIKKNDVLQAKMKETNKAVLVTEDFNEWLVSTGFALFTPEAVGNSSDFFYQYVKSELFNKQKDALSTGSTQQSINDSDLKKIVVKIPSEKYEQEKIANILSTIDTNIEQTEHLIDKYKLIKAGMMQDLFTRGVLSDGSLRLSREEAPELYKETPIGWSPKEWKLEQMGKLFNIQLGKMLSSVSKTGKNSAVYLGNKNVQWDNVNLTDLEEMDFNPRERKKFELKKGDLLVCEGGEVGRAAIWNEEIKQCYYQKAIHRLRPISQSMLPYFALRYLRYARDTGVLINYTSQTSIAHLTQEKLFKVPIPLPSYSEQARISSRFDLIDILLKNEISLLKKLNKQKFGLMNDLLLGNVRVNMKNKEAS